MMTILLGTTSEQKINILKNIFQDATVVPFAADSGITDQPLDVLTTEMGATNRARSAISLFDSENFDLAVGLEGGLSLVDGLFNLVCVAAVVDKKGEIFTGVSPLVPLPEVVSEDVKNGAQFGESIRKYKANQAKNLDSEELQVLDELINREKSFTEAFLLAYKNKQK